MAFMNNSAIFPFQVTRIRLLIICVSSVFIFYIILWNVNSKILIPTEAEIIEIISKDSTSKPAVLVVIGSQNQLESYQLAQNTLACYCKIYGYRFIQVFYNESPEMQKLCPFKHIWFQKVCITLRTLQLNSDIEYLFFFGADIGVINPNHRLEDYINPKYDLAFYERITNFDIMSDSFIIKNTEFSRKFFQDWIELEKQFTVGYGTNDQAALHQMFLNRYYPNHPVKEKCENIWAKNINNTVNVLEGHTGYVVCSMVIMNETREFDKIIIYPKASTKVWTRDIWLTKSKWAPRDFLLHDMEQYKISNDPEQLKRDYMYYPNPFMSDAVFVSSHCIMPSGLNNWKYNTTLIVNNEYVSEELQKKAKEVSQKYLELIKNL